MSRTAQVIAVSQLKRRLEMRKLTVVGSLLIK